MQRIEIRLEILKLVHRRDRESEPNIEQARAYEKYVFEGEPAEPMAEVGQPVERKLAGRPKKNVDNLSDILS